MIRMSMYYLQENKGWTQDTYLHHIHLIPIYVCGFYAIAIFFHTFLYILVVVNNLVFLSSANHYFLLLMRGIDQFVPLNIYS